MSSRSYGLLYFSLAAVLMASTSWAGPPATGGSDTIGAYIPSQERFYLRNSNTAGPPDAGNFKYAITAPTGDEIPLACDWNGDGTSTIGVYIPSQERFYLRNSNTAGPPDAGNFKFAITPATGDEIPVVGDWDGDGSCSIGVYIPSQERFYLRNSNTAGPPDAGNFKYAITPAASDETPVVGDWNGDHSSTIGVYIPAQERFYLRNSNTAGAPDAGNFKYAITAPTGDETPVTGDWNNDGSASIGVYIMSQERFYLRDSNTTGPPDAGNFKYAITPATSDEKPVTGDWDNL